MMRRLYFLQWIWIFMVMHLGIDTRLMGDEKGTSWHAEGANGAVAAGGKAAAEAGLEMMRQGGNAVDAAAATLLGLGVTDSRSYCLGGEIPIMIYNAKRGIVEVIAGQGPAPRLATVEFFKKQPEGIPATGLLSATVPAAIDAIIVALERHGTMRFAQVVEPTLKLLEKNDEEWHADLHKTLSAMKAADEKHSDRILGLRAARDYFYKGPVARGIDAFCRENGGLIRYEDIATFQSQIDRPISLKYRDYEILKCGYWTQGPALLEALGILSGFDLAGMKAGSADAIHVQAEAIKLALADRDDYYADPDFAEVPDIGDLLDPEYAAARRGLVRMDQASLERIPGDPKQKKARRTTPPVAAGNGGPALDTTTCVTADKDGNMVAATPSGWSGVVAGKTGIWLGTRLQSFTLDPSSPNVLVPGKRPRITLTPTLIMKDGKAVGAISVAGGDGQDQAMIQVLTNLVDFKMEPKDAVIQGRFQTEHHVGSFRQTPPKLGSLYLEEEVKDDVVGELAKRGHVIERKRGAQSQPIAIWRNQGTGRIQAAGDPRARRNAVAY